MRRILSYLLISSTFLLPHCLKKKGPKPSFTTTPIVNETKRRLEVTIRSENIKEKIFLDPYEKKVLNLPFKKAYIDARYHTQYGYKLTTIQNKERPIKANKKIVIKGDNPKYFAVTIKPNN
ncbi:hypothetical protein KAW80_01265 [Candidatus Babeliales bacterium]|nr:hypothetical protein [Candidatus Babeliales bacterium]